MPIGRDENELSTAFIHVADFSRPFRAEKAELCFLQYVHWVCVGSKSLGLDQPPCRGLDDCLSASRGAEFISRIIDVKIDRAFGQAENPRNFHRCLAAGDPGQYLDFAIVEPDRLRPNAVASDPGKPRIDDGSEHVEIDRLDDVIVGAQLPPLQLVVAVGQRSQEYKWHS